MCDTLRKTRSRGRSGVPLIRLRWRSEILLRRSFVVLIFMALLLRSRLAGLLLQHFTRVADALLLVGVRLAELADVGDERSDAPAIADADYGEVLAEAFGHALDGVGDETARQAVELAERGVVAPRLALQLIAF